ncbi:MAG: hypothetical protein ACSLFA_27975 [Mycobacterium sp.]
MPIAQDGRPSVSGAGNSEVLDAAVSGVGLEPAFQPIVSLEDGSVVGFESLMRWPVLGDPDPEAVFSHAAATDGLADSISCVSKPRWRTHCCGDYRMAPCSR